MYKKFTFAHKNLLETTNSEQKRPQIKVSTYRESVFKMNDMVIGYIEPVRRSRVVVTA